MPGNPQRSLSSSDVVQASQVKAPPERVPSSSVASSAAHKVADAVVSQDDHDLLRKWPDKQRWQLCKSHPTEFPRKCPFRDRLERPGCDPERCWNAEKRLCSECVAAGAVSEHTLYVEIVRVPLPPPPDPEATPARAEAAQRATAKALDSGGKVKGGAAPSSPSWKNAIADGRDLDKSRAQLLMKARIPRFRMLESLRRLKGSSKLPSSGVQLLMIPNAVFVERMAGMGGYLSALLAVRTRAVILETFATSVKQSEPNARPLGEASSLEHPIPRMEPPLGEYPIEMFGENVLRMVELVPGQAAEDKVYVGDLVQFVKWRGTRQVQSTVATIVAKECMLQVKDIRLDISEEVMRNGKTTVQYRSIWTRDTS